MTYIYIYEPGLVIGRFDGSGSGRAESVDYVIGRTGPRPRIMNNWLAEPSRAMIISNRISRAGKQPRIQ